MRYALRKVPVFFLTLWGAITLNFLIPRLMPGTPAEAALSKFAGMGPVSSAQLRAIQATLGVPHGSLISQYGQYLNDIAHGKFGISYTYFPEPVSKLIIQALPWTLALVGVVTIMAFIIGTLFGVLAAWRRNKLFDSLATVSCTFSSAFPYFWTGLLFLFVFGFVLGWFPIKGGYGASVTPDVSLNFFGDALYHSLLPAGTLLVSGMGGWLLGMRNNMIPVLGEDYVTFAEANGLRSRKIALRYAARNAILPNLTGFGMALGFVVSGSILTEVVFSYPGVGFLLYNAVINNDYPLMQALFLIITITVLVANFLVDLLYGWLDPRVRR